MKYFPLLLHFILACCVVGLAVGLNAEQVRPAYQYTVNGLAVGLGVSAFLRALISMF